VSIQPTDPTLRAALFLTNHPAWSPRDLDTADPDLIDLMRAIDGAVAKVREAKQREG
jgi:hypothetical protein